MGILFVIGSWRFKAKKVKTLPSTILDKIPEIGKCQSYFLGLKKTNKGNRYGYFKARRRFFPTNSFNSTDLQFICKRLTVEYSDEYFENYNPTTYRRHRTIFLDYFGYATFKVNTHQPLINELIEKPLWSFDRAALILGSILEFLEFRHIELPSNYMLQTILTIAIRKRNRTFHQKLDRLLLENYKTALDPLLLKASTGILVCIKTMKYIICHFLKYKSSRQ